MVRLAKMSHSSRAKPHALNAAELDYLAIGQFVFLHAGCLLLFWTGISWVAVIACFAFYCFRIFAISAGYHRYFSHRSYRTSRTFQFILALAGCMSNQKARSGGLLTTGITTRIRTAKLTFIPLANMDFGGLIVYGFFRSVIVRPTRNSQETLSNTLSCVCWINFTVCHLSSRPLYFFCSALF